MKYVKQFGIILLISFAGEALNYLLPLFAYLAIAVITTVLVMAVSGRVTQFFLRRGKEV